MATSKKQSKAAYIRAYQAKNPGASVKQVADACKTSPAYVYLVNANQKMKKAKWETVSVGTSNKSIVKHLGATMAKDDVTKLTDEQTSRLVYNMTKARARMQAPERAEEPQVDNVNHPAHYKIGGIETIDFIEAKLTPEEFRGYLKGNVLKYVSRSNGKDSYETDMLKARWYLNREAERFVKAGNEEAT